MKFEIMENVANAKPLCEEYDMDDILDYANYLSVVAVHGVVYGATEIGSGVCIVANGDLKQGEAGFEDMKAQSKVFRKALKMAIDRGDENSEYFKVILDRYEQNGIRMPFHKPFFED